jgi:predicted MPP superfamily phosphohydrolase
VATFLAVLVLILGTCWAIVGGLLAPVVRGGWLGVVLAAVLLTILPLSIFVASRMVGRYPGAAVRLLVFRPFWYAQALLLLAAPVGALGAVIGAPFGSAGVVGRGALGIVAVGFAVLMLFGYLDSRRVVVKRFEMHFPNLPGELDGLRIAQISDAHVGPHTPRRHLARIARATREAEPHLIAHTGDMVDDYPDDVGHFAAGLGALSAPLGVFAIAGNHDVYAGWSDVRSQLDRLPITTLVNEWRSLEHNGRRFTVVGTGDPAAGGNPRPGSAAPDIDAALTGVPEGDFVIALAHNPALWPALAKRGVDLTLSGHTHWGQFAIPRLGWSLASAFLDLAMGEYERDGSKLYVHPGTNYWGIPFRLGTPPEVAVLTLRKG